MLATIMIVPSSARADDLADLCRDESPRVKRLLDALDLARPGLERVKAAAEANDMPGAMKALLDHYKSAETATWLRRPAPTPSDRTDEAAEKLLNDTITVQHKEAKVPRLANGRIDWNFAGPENERQWSLIFLRHYFLRSAALAYADTGKEAYAKAINEYLRDFILSNPPPDKRSNGPPWGGGLEVAARLRAWAAIFYALQHTDSFTPSTRVLMLSAIPEHAEHLLLFHTRGSNMALLQMHGLAEAGAAFPEFKRGKAWLNYAQNICEKEARSTIYPDGAHKELTDMYHFYSTASLEGVEENLRRGGLKPSQLLRDTMERMWAYSAYIVSPDGFNPAGNDSDYKNFTPQIIDAAKRYNRPDWTYIATNGKEGAKPADTTKDFVVRGASVVFPWAGQVYMRNGFDREAQWSYFDAGPWGENQATGAGHQHHDALHLSVSAFGRPLLVDGGRYTYMTNLWWHYFTHSASHNVVLLDGRGQNPRETVAEKPLDTNTYTLADRFDFAVARFDDGFGDESSRNVPKGGRKPNPFPGEHTRAVMYIRDTGWLVVDRVTSEKARTHQTLWHFHPDCTVVSYGNNATSTDDGKGNLRIVPALQPGVDAAIMKIELVKGREKPTVQGWYGKEYGEKYPAFTAIYTTPFDKSLTTAWLLVPAKGGVPKATLTIAESGEHAVTLVARVGDQPPIKATLPLTPAKAQPALETGDRK